MTVTDTNICLISAKDLYRITRVVRQARALRDAGYSVTVYCRGLPHEELLARAKDIDFVVITDREERSVASSAVREALVSAGLDASPMAVVRLIARALHHRAVIFAFFRKIEVALRNLLAVIPRRHEDVQAGELGAADDEGQRAILQTEPSATLGLISRLAIRMLMSARNLSHAAFAAAVQQRILAGGPLPDVVQAHDIHSIIIGDVISRRFGAKLVYDAVEITGHQVRPTGIFARWAATVDATYRKVEERIIARADRVITIGESAAEWYQRTYQIANLPVVPIRNARDYEELTEDRRIREDCGIERDTPTLFWCGIGAPHRGIELVLDLLQRLPDYHAIFVTEFSAVWDDYRVSLERRIAREQLGTRVHFLPMRPPNDIVAYASGADVGVIVGMADAPLNVLYQLPNKFFEMVMARLPVVSANLINVRKVLEANGNGIELTGKLDQSAAQIRELVERKTTPEYRAVLEATARTLSWGIESRRLTALYDELTGRSSAFSPDQIS